jgi:hypothetical protein
MKMNHLPESTSQLKSLYARQMESTQVAEIGEPEVKGPRPCQLSGLSVVARSNVPKVTNASRAEAFEIEGPE